MSTTTHGQYITGGYSIDLVWVIDLTGSMHPYLETAKNNARTLSSLAQEKMEDVGKSIDKLRVRIIGFRDYKYDGKDAIQASRFFTLPEENEELQAFLDSLTATGGGDAPENSLEALALAMGSDWNIDSEQSRQCIMLFTDTNAVPLRDPARTGNAIYPEDMLSDITELTACWSATNQTPYTMPNNRNGRLLLFAPRTEPWNSLASQSWTWHVASNAGEGLKEHDIESVIELFVNSVNV